MNPSEQHDDTAELERRLRDAFAAQALQISDADLDHDREDEVAAALSGRHRRHPATRWFAGIGAAAAAAAIVGVTFVGLQDHGHREVVDGLPPAVTKSSSSTSAGSSTTSSPSSSTTTRSTPNARRPSGPGLETSSSQPTTEESSTSSSAPTSATTPTTPPEPSTPSSSAPPSTASGESLGASVSAAGRRPPALPGGLPQSGALGGEEYSGAVPLDDPAGGAKRMLSMPSDLKWQRTAQSGNSLTVRITYLPSDLDAYWQQTLPGQGWVANGAGWTYPDTGYTVSPITDTGSFTVTW